MDRKFKSGDTVLYGTSGICEVAEVTEKTFNRQTMEYYVLRPVKQPKTTVFVPLANPNLVGRIKKLMTEKEIKKTIKELDSDVFDWISNDNDRRKDFSETLMSGDRSKMLHMIIALYEKRNTQIENGKKLHAADEKFLYEAEKLINDEFSFVLGIAPEEVPEFIKEEIEA